MTEGKNHRTRWTAEEDAFLQSEWDGTHYTATVIAELLGRTTNAVAQRHYMLEWGIAADPVVEKVQPVDRPARPVTVTRRVETVTFEVDPARVCSSCWTVRSATGECLCS